MLFSRVLLSVGFACFLGAALAACDNAAKAPSSDASMPPADAASGLDASEDPALTCTPTECGPRPVPSTFLCPDGTLGGYGACRRGADGACGYVYYACGQTDGGTVGDAQLDATHHDSSHDRPDAATMPGCGQTGGVTCAVDQFCDLSGEASCGTAAVGGKCVPKPIACEGEPAPVCGCDNRTYPSACQANALGVSIRHDGACTIEECGEAGGTSKTGDEAAPARCDPNDDEWELQGRQPTICCVPSLDTDNICGGIAHFTCGLGEWCSYDEGPEGQRCGAGDASGVCRRGAFDCIPGEYKPVCSCGPHRTYPSACRAHAAGASVYHEGVCTDVDCKRSGGRPVNGTGAPPRCATGEVSYGSIRYEDGSFSIEGTICCAPAP